MATRFPQSGSSVAYQIKAAWASKIHVLYWAAGADSLHRLRSGDTSTTILTRSASGCTFDATNGVIEGNNSTRFTDSIAGGYGALQENSNFTFGASWWGDCFYGVPNATGISANSAQPPTGSFQMRTTSNEIGWYLHNGDGYNAPANPVSDDVVGWMTIATRHDQADATADIRTWCNGSEFDSRRVVSASPSSTSLLGDTGRPLYIGDSKTGSGNTKAHFEFAFLAGVLTDAEMATITSDPASIIEEVTGATIDLTPNPTTVQVSATRQFTITRSAAAEAGGVTYNLSSSNTDVATVPATATITEGNTTITFDATGVSIGNVTITATNAADSGETDAAALEVTAATVTTLKILAHVDAVGATSVKGAVFSAPSGSDVTGAKIGEFSGQGFEAVAEGGQAALYVAVSAFGGGALTTSDTPVCVWEATSSATSALGNAVAIGSNGPHECTVVEV